MADSESSCSVSPAGGRLQLWSGPEPKQTGQRVCFLLHFLIYFLANWWLIFLKMLQINVFTPPVTCLLIVGLQKLRLQVYIFVQSCHRHVSVHKAQRARKVSVLKPLIKHLKQNPRPQSAAVRVMAKARGAQMTSGTGQCVTAAVMNFSQAESKSAASLAESHWDALKCNGTERRFQRKASIFWLFWWLTKFVQSSHTPEMSPFAWRGGSGVGEIRDENPPQIRINLVLFLSGSAAAVEDGGKTSVLAQFGFSLCFRSCWVRLQRADYNIWHLSDI